MTDRFNPRPRTVVYRSPRKKRTGPPWFVRLWRKYRHLLPTAGGEDR